MKKWMKVGGKIDEFRCKKYLKVEGKNG